MYRTNHKPSSIFDKPCIGKNVITYFTSETLWMPVSIHRFDNSSNDVFPTASTTWRIKLLKVILAILTPIKLKKHTAC